MKNIYSVEKITTWLSIYLGRKGYKTEVYSDLFLPARVPVYASKALSESDDRWATTEFSEYEWQDYQGWLRDGLTDREKERYDLWALGFNCAAIARKEGKTTQALAAARVRVRTKLERRIDAA